MASWEAARSQRRTGVGSGPTLLPGGSISSVGRWAPRANAEPLPSVINVTTKRPKPKATAKPKPTPRSKTADNATTVAPCTFSIPGSSGGVCSSKPISCAEAQVTLDQLSGLKAGIAGTGAFGFATMLNLHRIIGAVAPPCKPSQLPTF